MNPHPTSTVHLPERLNESDLSKRFAFSKNKIDSEDHLFMVILIDALLLNAMLYGFIRVSLFPKSIDPENIVALIFFVTVVNMVWFFVVIYTKIYQMSGGVKVKLPIKDLFWGNVIFFGIISLIYHQFFAPYFEVRFLFPLFLCYTAAAALVHIGMRYYNLTRTGSLYYVIVGGKDQRIRSVTRGFEAAYGRNVHCLGRFANENMPGITHLGGCDKIAELLKVQPIDKLLYFDGTLPGNEVEKVVQLCRHNFVEFTVVPKEMDYFPSGIQVEQLSNLTVFHRKKEPLNKLENKLLKRLFDIVFSLLIILFVFSWLIPIVGCIIKLTSRGPVFFIQNRTGYWSKPFRCLKFRTMEVNAQSDELQATQGDPRITWIGAFLRKTNLDELPQFINVLMGDMSVVGPRPHMLKHTEDYAIMIDKFMIRHETKPGITGWAQVNGWRGPTTEVIQMAKRVEFDVYYIENWDFWFDLKCIFFTVVNMVKGDKNAF